jgi:hypothetical protein
VCALLTKQIDKEILYGDATVAIYQGFTSLDVVGHYMPDLASLGPLFDSYGFLVLDVTTCRVIGHRRMALVNREVNTWAGTLELGLPPRGFPGGVVIVYPIGPTGTDQVLPILQGTILVPPPGAADASQP